MNKTAPNSFTRILVAGAALVIILAGIKSAGEIVIPFLLSLFIAIICSPLIKFMTLRKVPLWLAVLVLFLAILCIFVFLIGMINGTVIEFTASISQYKNVLVERLSTLSKLTAQWNLPIEIPDEQFIENFDPSIIMQFVSRVLLSFSGVVSNVFMLLLVVVFMLFEAPYAKHKIAVALSRSVNITPHEQHIDRILQSIIRYLGVKTLICLFTGFSIWAVLSLFGVQYALLWATLSFLMNYIPNIGAVLATIPIVIQAFLLNGFSVGAGVTVSVILVNMLIGNILEPKLMGRTLGLSTLVIFLSLLFWGWLLGTVGMLLSVPLTMVIKIALESSPKTVCYAVLLSNIEKK